MNIESIHRHHFIFPVFRKIEEKLAYPTGYPDVYRKISLKIFSELKEQDLCQPKAVCKEWKRIIQETFLWKKLYQKSFTVRPGGKNQEIKTNHINDFFNFLASLPSKTLKSMLCSGNDLNDDELKGVFDAHHKTQIFKNSQVDNIKFLQLYPTHQLHAYLQKLNNYLDQSTSSRDCANYYLPKDEIKELEEFYTLALKLAIYEKDFVQESFYIEKLGDIYVEKATAETFLQAAGFYNYVLHDFSSAKRHEIIRSKLSKVEILLIKLCTEKLLNLDVRQAYFVENRKLLKAFRNQIEKKMQTFSEDPSFEEVRELYREITQGVKSFFSSLVNQSEEALGASPCEYAMIGFGSLAREEMTPYSDLEFGILVQENTPTTRKYFKSLTFLLHLQVINLGETILPALNIPCLKAISFFDDRTPRGFCFDGAGVEGKGCKTPFGNGRTFELINTPEKMAQYIAKNEEGRWWYDQEPHLPMELLTFTHLLGNPELTSRYSQKVQEILETPYQEKFTLRQHLAKHHLIQQDMKNFDPGVETLENQGMLFKAKNDFYRFPHLAIDRLALLLKVTSSDTFARIVQLNQQEILTGEAAKKLKEWMSIALFMRLKTYFYYQAQNDSMNPLIKPFGFDEPEIVQKCLALDHKTLEKIKKFMEYLFLFTRLSKSF
ncbi:F-box-like domain-containing protein [Neochlamydia sp. EPS4]|uniref:F-box-like domain-containing protein n=1 Tax=Neochlamydia sp. EPS4 TaxID=1478175 RepID=UPI0005D0F7E8|nr:F-box-like domain-containing protein [Neochlamydia sp. EPS4]